MSRLEDLRPNAAVRGILPDAIVTVVNTQWFGSEALDLTYKAPTGRVANELLYRHDEPRLEVVEQGRPWSFDGDGSLCRLVSEAQRIRLAHLFDPVLAVHTSVVEPLPHQITAVYESMLPRQPLRFLLADDPGAGKEPGNAAETAARTILESRGNTPRLYRNTLVFLAADKVRLQDLDEAVRRFLAWKSILEEKKALNLDPHQEQQAETQKQAADGAVTARLPETYQWLLVPEQANPQAPITWQAIRLSAADALAARASKRLRSDESLVTSLGSTILRKHLDDVPLWRGDHVAVKLLVEDFARYLYLPRLGGPEVLAQAIRDGLALLTWQTDTFPQPRLPHLPS